MDAAKVIRVTGCMKHVPLKGKRAPDGGGRIGRAQGRPEHAAQVRPDG
jgi:hypothetical protein